LNDFFVAKYKALIVNKMNVNHFYFVRTKQEAFVARLIDIDDERLIFDHHRTDVHHSSFSNKSTYIYSPNSIVFYFDMSDFVQGRRYRFVDCYRRSLDDCFHSYFGEIVSIDEYEFCIKVDGEDGLTCSSIFMMNSIINF
jgi:hypothetical protein